MPTTTPVETRLHAAVAAALSVTRQRVSQRVGALQRRTPMTRLEALGVLAHEAGGIRLNEYFSSGEIGSIRTLIQSGSYNGIAKSRPALEPNPDIAPRASGTIDRRPDFEVRDIELHERCADLLTNSKKGKYDRPVREAFLVLEDRVRRRAALTEADFGKDLMGKAIGEHGPLVFSSVKSEQDAAKLMFMGAYGFYRNATSHRLGHNIGRVDAIVLVCFVDHLLGLVEAAAPKTP